VLRWRIRDGEVWVAAVRVADSGPTVLLASHLEPQQTILIYRVSSLEEVSRRLAAEGWSEVEPRFEIPQGPCLVFRDPGGQRLAVYERVRPQVDEHFEGRMD
jgi:predicted enzyme related to lactoylglutathione lyase